MDCKVTNERGVGGRNTLRKKRSGAFCGFPQAVALKFFIYILIYFLVFPRRRCVRAAHRRTPQGDCVPGHTRCRKNEKYFLYVRVRCLEAFATSRCTPLAPISGRYDPHTTHQNFDLARVSSRLQSFMRYTWGLGSASVGTWRPTMWNWRYCAHETRHGGGERERGGTRDGQRRVCAMPPQMMRPQKLSGEAGKKKNHGGFHSRFLHFPRLHQRSENKHRGDVKSAALCTYPVDLLDARLPHGEWICKDASKSNLRVWKEGEATRLMREKSST